MEPPSSVPRDSRFCPGQWTLVCRQLGDGRDSVQRTLGFWKEVWEAHFAPFPTLPAITLGSSVGQSSWSPPPHVLTVTVSAPTLGGRTREPCSGSLLFHFWAGRLLTTVSEMDTAQVLVL